MFEFLAHTGLRIGEAIELRWGRDLVLDDRADAQAALAVRRRPRLRAEDALRQARHPALARPRAEAAAREPPDADGELVFTTSLGTRLNRHNLYRDVLAPPPARRRCPWVTLHTFRHTCASLLFAPEHGGGGKNVKQVQEWLGHHSPAYTLQEYVHLIDAGVGDADFLDDVVGDRRTIQ